MIEIKNISKLFNGKKVLDNVSLSLYSGEIVALIGENGAGKSTLMRIMCGYLHPDEGSVNIFGYDAEKNRIKALSYIGYVPEISSLYGEMLVYDFLYWIAGIWNISDKNRAIFKAADLMHINDVLTEKIENLSKGYKKRVEIASALLHTPKILILDEPTDGLDPNQKHDIREFMKQYAHNNTVLVSTHVLEDAEVANRVIMLSKGRLIKDTDIETFKKASLSKDIGEAFRIISGKSKRKATGTIGRKSQKKQDTGNQ